MIDECSSYTIHSRFQSPNVDGWLSLWFFGLWFFLGGCCKFNVYLYLTFAKKIIFGINSQLLLVFKMNSQASGSMEFYRTLCYFFFYEIQNRNINYYNKINLGLERHDSPIYSSTDVNYLKSLNMSNFNKI